MAFLGETMPFFRLMIACLSFAWLPPGTAPTEVMQFSNPAAAAERPDAVGPWQVKVYRLRHADAGSLAKTLSGIFDPSKIKMAADSRTNSLVVRAASETHQIVEGLISKLDVPQTQGDFRPPDPPAETINTPNADTGASEKEQDVTFPSQKGTERSAFAVVRAPPQVRRALATLLSHSGGIHSTRSQQMAGTVDCFEGVKPDLPAEEPDEDLSAAEDGKITVVVRRASPLVQKSFEGLALRSGTENGGIEPSDNQRAGITVLRIPSAEALAQALRPERSGVTSVVVPASPSTARAVKELGSPAESKRR